MPAIKVLCHCTGRTIPVTNVLITNATHLALPLLAVSKEKGSIQLIFFDMIDDQLQMITTRSTKLAINHNTCHA